MPTTDATGARLLLKRLLDECELCKNEFQANIGTIVEEGESLTDEQVEAVFISLSDQHREHP